MKLLGKMPERVSLNSEVIETVDMGAYIREKAVYDSDKYDSIPAYVLTPKNIGSEKRPAILTAYGRDRGKVDVCGVVKNRKEYARFIYPLDYDYAVKFVERGYVVIAPDWRGFGERSSPEKWVRLSRDKCNINYFAYGYLGYNLLALQIWDGMRTLDYLQTRTEVDKNRLGCAGLSYGGTITTYLAALDNRIKVACISGYLNTIRGNQISKGNFCGVQYMPGLLTIGDIPDVAGLIAPRPLIVEMGKKDTSFPIENAKLAYVHLKKIYSASGMPECLDCDIHPKAHSWNGAKAYNFFKKWL